MTDEPGFDATLAAARAGDRDAVSRLYRGLQPRLLRFLRAEAGDAADDIASQTWLEVMGALRRFQGDEVGFRAFLFTVARRRLADHRRTQRRRPAVATDPVLLRARADPVLDVEALALSGVAADVAAERIAAALTKEQAEVVLLRVVGGLSVDEVAQIVGKKPGTVRVVQHRALKRLQQAFETPGGRDV